jgi:hypothetical protein
VDERGAAGAEQILVEGGERDHLALSTRWRRCWWRLGHVSLVSGLWIFLRGEGSI